MLRLSEYQIQVKWKHSSMIYLISCTVVIGIPTQCVQSKHINDAKKQYCANVCLKVNMKLGGMNLFLSPQQIPFISERPTIVFGGDVTHPAPGISCCSE